MRKILKNDKGFSLVELLAVVCILAILVSVALPAVSKYLDSSRRETLIDNSLAAISAVKSNMIMEGYNNKVYTIDEINNILDKKLYDSSFSGNSKFVGLGKGEVYSDDYEGSMIVASRELVDADTNKYKYEFKMCLYDEDGRGFYLTDEKKLDSNVVMLEGVTSCSKTASKELISGIENESFQKRVYDIDDTLQIGNAGKSVEYRFSGSDTDVKNNYVYFNCSDISNQTIDTCELYRMIGVFPVDNGTGKFENRIKLIKSEFYNGDTKYKWNDDGLNNWENATLNKEFNVTYWNSINANYQALVGNAKYYLGGFNDVLDIKTNEMYKYERKKEGSSYYYSGNPINWVGKIALMYPSDYGYAAGEVCTNNINLSDYDDSSCTNNNWLFSGKSEWILSPHASNNMRAMRVENRGYVMNYRAIVDVTGMVGVRPVFYLNSNVSFVGGDGSINDPYRLL